MNIFQKIAKSARSRAPPTLPIKAAKHRVFAIFDEALHRCLSQRNHTHVPYFLEFSRTFQAAKNLDAHFKLPT